MVEADALLAHLVGVFASLADGDGTTEPCDITIQVNGMLISGRLVSVLDFYRAYRDRGMPPRRDLWEQLIDREIKENEEVAILRNAVQETIGSDTAHLSARETDLLQRLHVDFLHLENAVIQTPGSAPVMLPVWRVRIVDVSGWMVGYLRDFEPLVTAPDAARSREPHRDSTRSRMTRVIAGSASGNSIAPGAAHTTPANESNAGVDDDRTPSTPDGVTTRSE